MKDIDRGAALEIYRRLYKYFGPQQWWPARTRFEVIVGAILTQNTSWSNVEKAIKNLKAAGVLRNPAYLKGLPIKKLTRLIRPAGYYNVKARRLKNFTDFLFSKHDGSLTRLAKQNTGSLRNELLGVNGIGPETCDSILLYAFNRPAFVIDAYTKRVFSRHGFFKEDTPYVQARGFFMAILPRRVKLYNEFHALIVRLAKEFCRKAPRCGRCPLNCLEIAAPR